MNLQAAALAVILAISPLAAAQSTRPPDASDLAAVRTALTTDKRGYVKQSLALTDAEAKRFWPIYDNYQRHLDTTVRRGNRLVEELVALDRPVTDANAKRIAAEMVAIEGEEARDRRRLANQLGRALPPAKALRYLQIENKAKALRAYDVAATLPLVK